MSLLILSSENVHTPIRGDSVLDQGQTFTTYFKEPVTIYPGQTVEVLSLRAIFRNPQPFIQSSITIEVPELGCTGYNGYDGNKNNMIGYVSAFETPAPKVPWSIDHPLTVTQLQTETVVKYDKVAAGSDKSKIINKQNWLFGDYGPSVDRSPNQNIWATGSDANTTFANTTVVMAQNIAVDVYDTSGGPPVPLKLEKEAYEVQVFKGSTINELINNTPDSTITWPDPIARYQLNSGEKIIFTKDPADYVALNSSVSVLGRGAELGANGVRFYALSNDNNDTYFDNNTFSSEQLYFPRTSLPLQVNTSGKRMINAFNVRLNMLNPQTLYFTPNQPDEHGNQDIFTSTPTSLNRGYNNSIVTEFTTNAIISAEVIIKLGPVPRQLSA